MTIAQLDQLQRVACRLSAASLAISGLDHSPDADCVAEQVLECVTELEQIAGARGARRLAIAG